jgi:hypothetical protein
LSASARFIALASTYVVSLPDTQTTVDISKEELATYVLAKAMNLADADNEYLAKVMNEMMKKPKQ